MAERDDRARFDDLVSRREPKADRDTVDDPERLQGQLRRRWCLLGNSEEIFPQRRSTGVVIR